MARESSRRPRPRLRQRLTGIAFVAPALAFVVLYFAYPAVKNIIMSFQDYTTSTFFTGSAPWVGFSNYVTVVRSPIFWETVSNTLLFTFCSIAGQFVIGMLLAVFFSKRFPLNNFFRAVMLLPWLIPLISTSAIWRWMLDPTSGIVDQILLDLHLIHNPVQWLADPNIALMSVILVNIWLGIPFNLTILYGGMKEIPGDLYEAGALDGVTGFRAFRYITWPLIQPVVTVVLVLGVVYTLKVFDIIIGLTGGGPANATQTLATNSYQLSFGQFQFGQGAALSNILVLFSFVFAAVYLFINRRSTEG